MRRVTASEARKHWFHLLDEVARGEAIEIDRRGTRIVIRREPVEADGDDVPDYRKLISASNVDDADDWSWDWSEGEITLREGSGP